jgi:hypothetical protein
VGWQDLSSAKLSIASRTLLVIRSSGTIASLGSQEKSFADLEVALQDGVF